MPSGYTPDVGVATPAAAQSLVQEPFVVVSNTFGAADDQIREQSFVTVRGLPWVRIQLFLYPEYDRGDFTFAARNYLQWRAVGTIPSSLIPAVSGLTNSMIPLTTPQILPVGQPIDYWIRAGGLYAVAIEIDTSSGVAMANQGRDLVLIATSASS